MPRLPENAALLVIDMQQAIDAPYWGPRNNPDAESHIAALLQHWRQQKRPLYHIRHDSTESHSAYRPGQPGHEFKPEAMPQPGETVIAKRGHSAFIGTRLERQLREAGQSAVVLCGVLTHNSVEATARHAADLGFTVYLAGDACWAVDKALADGRVVKAELVHALSLANLSGEYATITTTAELLSG